MTILEKGKFIKNFVRTMSKSNNVVRVPHSNKIGYSSKDVAEISPKVDENYWNAWEKFLEDKKNNAQLQASYKDYQHYLFGLNHIDEVDIQKYGLPSEYIMI